MSEFDKLRDLARSDRVIELEERADPDIQKLWEAYRVLGYTDEEIRAALRSLARNIYLMHRANSATDEHIREAAMDARSLRRADARGCPFGPRPFAPRGARAGHPA